MWNILFSNIGKHVLLSSHEMEVIQNYFKPKKYRKHQFVLQEGEICRYEHFIVNGLTRTYELNDRGQEHVIQFGLEGWWVGDMYSYLTETASRYNIDCMEDTTILQITRADQEVLYEKVPKLERFFRLLIQNAFIASTQRITSSLSKSGAERYQEFISKYPMIEQRVPNHQIASYLGLTPQGLSRIRSKITGKS